MSQTSQPTEQRRSEEIGASRATSIRHNGAPVIQWMPGYYRIADFLGRYTDQSGVSAQDAVESFVRSRTCNLLTSYKDHCAWKAAGYPTREAWLALQAAEVRS